MKIAVASDLHLESTFISFDNINNADVLVLAGDICVAAGLKNCAIEFFEHCAEQFPHIIYVAGNHEFYRDDITTSVDTLKQKFKHISNLHILDNECIELQGVLFVGSTLWTDMNSQDNLTKFHIKKCMNDFKLIENSNKTVQYNAKIADDKTEKRYRVAAFTPDDAIELHTTCLEYIDLICALNKNKPVVVVTHHSPSFRSVAPEYQCDDLMNGGYHSNCEWLYSKHENIKMHCFGHTHSRHAYYINRTFMVNNSRGYYKHEKLADTFALKCFDINQLPSETEILSDNYWSFYPKPPRFGKL